MKKPLPVLVLEFLAWVFFVIACCGAAFSLLRAAFYVHYRSGFEMSRTLLLVLLAILFAALLHAVRRARFAWFSIPPCVVMILVGGFVSSHMDSALAGIGLFLLVCVVALAPVVLLNLPKAKAWQREVSATGGKDKAGLMVALSLFAFFYAAVSIPSCVSRPRTHVYVAETEAKAINCGLDENNSSREKGGEWVDPSTCTNSTQFVNALYDKLGMERRHDDWCIAVNPPNDDRFPVLFTANIDPRELLCPQDEDQPLKLTCPKEWGGVCFKFCEKMGVVHYKNGVSQIVKKHMSPKQIFCSGIPKPGPETYFLTPTGRVDFAERQAADWLSIHEFASNEDSGDVSVKWRVAWPESLSGLNNEGLSSVRREILQMTFGPAWSDLNHGDKTWIPPPTIEEAEEEIKRKLEEPDIVWEFSGDVELDRPFGVSLQDGAEWYARPVIVAKNEGNSSFRWECGCTYYTIARTFSIPDGREMTVDDYFDRGKMKELSALVWRRLLESVFPFDDETRKGMGHRDINLRDRNLIFMRVMSGGICFYFAPYSIFSGADGVTKAFLKWGELSKFRKK